MNGLSVAAAAEDAPDALGLVFERERWSWARVADEVRRRPRPAPPFVALAPLATPADVLDVLAAFEAEVPLVLLHPAWSAAERAAARARVLAFAGPPPAAIVFTSGSSGRPKGVRLSARALVAAARAHAAALPWREDDRWLLTMPLAHVGGLGILTRALVARGAIALGPPRFEAEAVLDALHRHEATLLSLVPTMLERLASRPPPRSLRAALVGGAACPPELLARGREAGWPLLATYGATETTGQVCTQRLGHTAKDGVGPPLPGLEVRIVDGLVEVRGATLMDGYLDEPAPLHDGWLRTADHGALRDGELVIRGRADLAIVTGGENVDPLEVEAALRSHPAIAAACVVGVPDPRWGERVAALLVGEPISEDALEAHLTPRLARFKHPRALRWVLDLPTLPSGKVDRAAARGLMDTPPSSMGRSR